MQIGDVLFLTFVICSALFSIALYQFVKQVRKPPCPECRRPLEDGRCMWCGWNQPYTKKGE